MTEWSPEEWGAWICAVAAVIYLVVEAVDGRRLWREWRTPAREPEEPEYETRVVGQTGTGPPVSRRVEPRPMRETWPDDKVIEAEEEWTLMLESKSTTCPHCGFEAASMPEEIAHMTTWHPEVVAERLNAIGEGVTAEQIRATAGPDFPPKGVTE